MSVLSASVVFSQGQEGTDAPPPQGHAESRMPVYPINEMREVVVDQGGVELSSAPGAQEPVIQSVENNVPISRTPSEGQAFAEFQGNQQGDQLGNHVRRLDDLQGVPFQELIGFKPKPGWNQGDPIDEDCAICMNELSIEETLSTLPCGHTFHHTCIASWFKHRISHGQDGKCPGCNQVIVQAMGPDGAPVRYENVRISSRQRQAERVRQQLRLDTEIVPLFPVEVFPCCTCKWAQDIRTQRYKRRMWVFAFIVSIIVCVNIIIVFSDRPSS